ncbi:hypothetical protein [Mycolicibacterium holsaticum]|uniref:hypothetical protein n=1 Tax=Mycolicibacterium holsaticum TaxID=152142 RepID=UPI001042117D|nr:hypothetical protein [Mycolicibacterium holsaticum]
MRRVLPGSGDPVAFNSDGELLDKGRYVCYMRDANELVGYEATLVSAIVTQLAFIPMPELNDPPRRRRHRNV